MDGLSVTVEISNSSFTFSCLFPWQRYVFVSRVELSTVMAWLPYPGAPKKKYFSALWNTRDKNIPLLITCDRIFSTKLTRYISRTRKFQVVNLMFLICIEFLSQQVSAQLICDNPHNILLMGEPGALRVSNVPKVAFTFYSNILCKQRHEY